LPNTLPHPPAHLQHLLLLPNHLLRVESRRLFRHSCYLRLIWIGIKSAPLIAHRLASQLLLGKPLASKSRVSWSTHSSACTKPTNLLRKPQCAACFRLLYRVPTAGDLLAYYKAARPPSRASLAFLRLFIISLSPVSLPSFATPEQVGGSSIGILNREGLPA
jgi:hypothetical protein